MSPEQIEAKVVDHRTDIFSLGVLLYEMATGKRPFQGESSPALMSSILKDAPQSVVEVRSDLPRHLARIIGRCLEKDRRDRYQTARDIFNELRGLKRESSGESFASASRPAQPTQAAAKGSRAIVVAPFRAPKANQELTALAEGLAEDIGAGLARFPYLTILDGAEFGLSQDSTAAARSHGARWVLRGGLRSAGPEMRLSVQLVEVETGARVWSENYDRLLEGSSLFELQDGLTDRIVATVGDYSGVIPRLVVNELRATNHDEMTSDDWIMRAVCFNQIVYPPEEHAAIRDGLEAVIEREPNHAEAHAWLAAFYRAEHKFQYNVLDDPMGRSLRAAQRAVDLDPTSQAGWDALAAAYFFLGDLPAFEAAVPRAIALNPRNSFTTAFLGMLIGHTGQWERGSQLGLQACALNPHHPEWYLFATFYLHYERGEYEEAFAVSKRINWPQIPYSHVNLVAVCGQRGRPDQARASIKVLRETFGFDAATVRDEYRRWGHSENLIDHIVDGLMKAGFEGDASPPPSSGVMPFSQLGAEMVKDGASDVKSIAVLPFVNMSENSANEFFSDGVTEEILTNLSKIAGLHVISRTSAMTYKGTSKSIREIASELQVGTVLEGSVRRAGDRVRVTAQLIEAATDRHLWSEQYDRDLEDIFAIQSDVAENIAAALEAQLAPEVVERMRRRPTENMKAYDLFLRGRQNIWTMEAAKIEQGKEQIEKAIDLDPAFADAHAMMALERLLICYWAGGIGAEELPRGLEAAERALALDEACAVAWSARGAIRSHLEWDWKGAEDDFKRSLELDPNEALTHFLLSIMYFQCERLDEGLAAAETGVRLDPHSAVLYTQVGYCTWLLGRDEEAKRILVSAIERHPGDFNLHNVLGLLLRRSGRFEEAAEQFRIAGSLFGSHPWLAASEALCLRLAGDPDGMKRLLAKIDSSPDHLRNNDDVEMMTAVARSGDARVWLAELEKALDRRSVMAPWFVRVVWESVGDPPGDYAPEVFKPLPRNHPEVQRVLHRLWPEESFIVAPVEERGADESSDAIAVLPFSNLSADPEQEFFADGMADEILNALAQVPQLQVAARTSSFSFKGKDDDLQSIGRKLNVARVLEGSVRTVGNRVRITAQLINVSDGYQLWSERYDRTMDDIFAIQDEIAQSIVDRLRTVPAGAPAPASYQSACDEVRTPLVVRPTTSLEAYQLYLKGRSLYYGQMGEAAFRDAIEAYEKAIELDPRFAQPYVGIAEASVSRGFWGTQSAGVTFPKARRAAERALELQDSFGDAHAILGFLSAFYDVDWEASAASFARAEACRHTTSLIPFYQSLCLLFGGKFDDAISEIRKAQQLDPLSANINAHVAHELVWAGRLEEAEDELQRIERLHPGYWFNTYSRGLIAWVRGEGGEAIARLEEAVEQTGWMSDLLIAILHAAHYRFGSRDRAAEIFKVLEEPKGEFETAAFSFAFTHLLCGDNDQGLRWLAKAHDAHDGLFVAIKVVLERLNASISDEVLAQLNAWGIRGPAS